MYFLCFDNRVVPSATYCCRTGPSGSSGASGGGGRSLAVLDAGVVNVYQGVSAIIFMVDPYRPETLDKVCARRDNTRLP